MRVAVFQWRVAGVSVALDFHFAAGEAFSSAERQVANVVVPTFWNSHVRLLERSGGDWRLTYQLAGSEFGSSPEATLNALAKVGAELARSCGAGEIILTIPALRADGFDIHVSLEKSAIRVSFGGLDQDFASVAGLMTWIERALSCRYRLRVVTIGGLPREWALEPSEGNVEDHETLASGQLILFGTFRSRVTSYRQNRLIP